ncbi:MAG: cyclic nucleotide-binding protein [Proteobacteria bacterium]|nr:cyclic nucleotide-binding protein [Pseudomonadota bacterium]
MYRPAVAPIEPITVERLAEPGEALFFEGDPCDYVYELRSGIARGVSLSADGERQISAFFFAGDQIGLPVAEAYRFTAEAVTQLCYVCHSRARWHEALVRSWREEGRLLPSICAEQDPIFRRGIIIGRNGLLIRICAFLHCIVDRLPRDGEAFVLPLTQSDIGAYLATTPESVCRGFRQLREMGVIAMPSRERLQVLDRPRLEAIASGAQN